MKIKPMNNKVLISAKEVNDHINLKGGVTLFLDTSFEEEHHAATKGEVIAVPDEIKFSMKKARYRGDFTLTNNFDVDQELEPGDTVYFHYGQINECLRNKKYVDVDGERFYFLEYEHIYLAKRGDDIVMINGYILVEPIEEIQSVPKNLIVPDHLRTRKSCKVGIIKAIGNPVRRYRDTGETDPLMELKVGDVIQFDKYSDVPIQQDIHRDIDGDKLLYRMQRREVCGILENFEV